MKDVLLLVYNADREGIHRLAENEAHTHSLLLLLLFVKSSQMINPRVKDPFPY